MHRKLNLTAFLSPYFNKIVDITQVSEFYLTKTYLIEIIKSKLIQFWDFVIENNVKSMLNFSVFLKYS